MDEAVDADELLAQQLLQARRDPLAGVEIPGDDHDLAEEGIGELLVERQVEAHGALADIGAPAHDVGVADQRLLQPVHLDLGLGDRARLQQGHVDQQLGPVGGREELVLHVAQPDERQREQAPA